MSPCLRDAESVQAHRLLCVDYDVLLLLQKSCTIRLLLLVRSGRATCRVRATVRPMLKWLSP